jgi:hypothetical protein
MTVDCGLRSAFAPLGVLTFGLPVDRNIGVGVLPQIQESLVRLPCGCFIAHHLLRSRDLHMSQCPDYVSSGGSAFSRTRHIAGRCAGCLLVGPLSFGSDRYLVGHKLDPATRMLHLAGFETHKPRRR